MKQFLRPVLPLLATLWLGTAQAGDTLDILGNTFTVDTLFHNQIGPGVTQTSLSLRGNVNLRAFYATLDLTNPYLSLECLVAANRLQSTNTLDYMIGKHTREGHRQFMGINGDFFDVSGQSTHRGVRFWGSPTGPTMSDGEVFLTRANASSYASFIADTDGQVYINPFNYRGVLATAGGEQAVVSAINPVQAAPENNAVTIYNSYFFGSSDAFGGCEVSAKLASGEPAFHATGTTRLVVTSDPNTEGDMLIPNKGFVLHASGTAEQVLAALKPGDEIEVNMTCSIGGLNIDPEQVISGNPVILANGQPIYNGNRDRHPRTAIGYSDGGKKVYFLVVDGRQSLSAGIEIDGLPSIMRYAGATDAMNLDGGGSSILYTTMLGPRNNPSIGTDRATGNAMFAVYNAPDDNTIAELRFQDYRLSTARYGVYVPHFFGYNQYGLLIDTDVQGVKLSCPDGFGRIKNDSVFFAIGTGTDLLTATLGDVSVAMPMTIVGDSLDNMELVHHSIVTDGLRDYTVEAQSVMAGTAQPLAAEALSWATSDPTVVAIEANTGVMRGLRNGTAQVCGTIDGITDTMTVTVERPTARVMTADSLRADTWRISMRAGKDGAATQLTDGGFRWDYTGATGRLPRLLLEKELRLWSLPDTLRLRINPGNAPVKQVVFSLYAGDGKLNSVTAVPDTVIADQPITLDLPTAQWTPADDMGSYPITLSAIQLDLNAMTSDEPYHLEINGLETVYARVPDTPAVPGDADGNGITDIDDVNLVINIMLGRTPATDAADVNGSGNIDIDDLNLIINVMLGKHQP